MTDNESKLPSIETLRRVVSYDAETGALVWIARTADLFPQNSGRESFNRKYAGKPIGKRNAGYVIVNFSMEGKPMSMQGHRLGFALHTGKWPEEEIDHRNLQRDDNRFDNLREASHAQNNQNKTITTRNASGFKGVHFHKNSGKWRAQLRIGSTRKDLGLHLTPELAGAAYAAASKQLHGQFSNV